MIYPVAVMHSALQETNGQHWHRWLKRQPLRDGIKRALGLPVPKRWHRQFVVTDCNEDSMCIEAASKR